MKKEVWVDQIKCWLLVSVFAAIGNYIASTKAGAPVTPVEAIPGLLVILGITAAGCLIHDLIDMVSPKNLPAIAYISLVAIIVTIPGLLPFAEFCIEEIGKIGLLPLCTPILAYAGISLGKDMNTFKEQGIAIVLVALFTFIGTFIGSAIIAEVVLQITGVI